MAVVPVLLSGGVGSRLWPLSRAATPKQLQNLLGDSTMIQATAQRVDGLDDLALPIVVCGERHGDAIREQLTQIGQPPQIVIREPVGRNTAPAVLLAALAASPDDILLVLPADAVVLDVDGFRAALSTAIRAASAGFLVTFGVVPTRPETGYGYIRTGAAVAGEVDVIRVGAFVEMPVLVTARKYLEHGGYLWNSGMFVFQAGVVREEIARLAPAVFEAIVTSVPARLTGPDVRPTALFDATPSISFDHAVMESTDKAVVVPLEVGWSDVGSWATLWEIDDKDADGNVVRGDSVVHDVRNSYVRSDGRLVAVIGLEDVVVVDTGDAILVAARDRVQDVKAVVEHLAGRPEIDGPT
jgi:mannose-1-phosphate guanylyltransferase/mannose-6-phosphate isomerase